MKTLLMIIIAVLPIQWGTDLEVAKNQAREQHKMILLNFSGSDWCAPCILTRKEFFEKELFAKMAGDELILVNADFPRKKKNRLSPGQIKANELLAERYNKEGTFPCTLLLDAEGKVVGEWRGKPDQSLEQWVAEIRRLCHMHKK